MKLRALFVFAACSALPVAAVAAPPAAVSSTLPPTPAQIGAVPVGGAVDANTVTGVLNYPTATSLFALLGAMCQTSGCSLTGPFYVSVPSNTPGISDASVLGLTNIVVPRAMGAVGNEFSISAQGVVPVTSGTQSYEKAAVYSRITTKDPADYTNNYLRDAVGVESQANISGTLLGRVWAYDALLNIPAGSDGYASGMELGLTNNGSDQPIIGTSTTKNGMHLVGAGSYGGTSGIQFDGKWHYGVTCTSSSITNDCIYLTNGTSTLAEITPAGQGNFTKLGLIGGGTSTATFTNFCYTESGTPYLGACLYGASNAPSGQYSAVGGFAATDRGEYGGAHFGSTNSNHGQGDNQWGWRVLSGTIPAGGGTIRLLSQSNNGAAVTPTAINSIPLAANTAFEIDCKMAAHLYNGQDSASWSLDDGLFDEGATASTARRISGSWTQTAASSGASGILTPTITADTTLGSFNVSVTASSGGPWDISARCFTTESR